MERVIVRVLTLLRSIECSPEELKLKVDCSSDQLTLLLEWGETQGLWFKNPISQAYMISDTGELPLRTSMVEDLLRVHPLQLDKLEFDHLLRKLKRVESCLTSI